MEKPINLTALAAALQLPRDWLKKQAEAGRIPCLRVGRKLRFNLRNKEEICPCLLLCR